MGAAGLILGILAIIGAFIPGLVNIAWLLAAIGIVTSIVALKKGVQPRLLVVLGLVFCIIGLLVSLSTLLLCMVCTGLMQAGSGF